ncbi:MAG: phosphatase PAP2 family protein [Alphaproteobacteria bacterium]|nr:phosphatase PAP2 family protein [Alphaproteobacteria bacterium]
MATESYFSDSVPKELFYDWAGANRWMFLQINELSGSNETYDQAMKFISNASDGKHVFLFYLAALVIIGLFSTITGAIKKHVGIRYHFNHWIAVIALFAVAFPVNAAINHSLKDYFGYPRPYVAFKTTTKFKTLAEAEDFKRTSHTVSEMREVFPEIHQLEKRSADDDYRSFPSGHVAFITCLIACLWSKLSESQRPLGALAILLVGWSRMALGVHFPADVVGSIIITLVVMSLMKIAVFSILSKGLRLKW